MLEDSEQSEEIAGERCGEEFRCIVHVLGTHASGYREFLGDSFGRKALSEKLVLSSQARCRVFVAEIGGCFQVSTSDLGAREEPGAGTCGCEWTGGISDVFFVGSLEIIGVCKVVESGNARDHVIAGELSVLRVLSHRLLTQLVHIYGPVNFHRRYRC